MCSTWKLKNVNIIFNLAKKKLVKTFSRDAVVTKSLVGKTLSVHNGTYFVDLVVTRDHVGYKAGDFIFTRKYVEKSKEEKVKKTT